MAIRAFLIGPTWGSLKLPTPAELPILFFISPPQSFFSRCAISAIISNSRHKERGLIIRNSVVYSNVPTKFTTQSSHGSTRGNSGDWRTQSGCSLSYKACIPTRLSRIGHLHKTMDHQNLPKNHQIITSKPPPTEALTLHDLLSPSRVPAQVWYFTSNFGTSFLHSFGLNIGMLVYFSIRSGSTFSG